MALEALRSFEKWRESVRNFDWLRRSVSGAMDIDCMIERKGHLLFIEGKPWESSGGVRIGYGQYKALRTLSQLPTATVLVVADGREDDMHLLVMSPSNPPNYQRQGNVAVWPAEAFTPTTRDAVAEMVKQWWASASEAEG